MTPAQDPTLVIGWVGLEGLLMFLDIIFVLLTLSYCNPFKQVPNKTKYAVSSLGCLV